MKKTIVKEGKKFGVNWSEIDIVGTRVEVERKTDSEEKLNEIIDSINKLIALCEQK